MCYESCCATHTHVHVSPSCIAHVSRIVESTRTWGGVVTMMIMVWTDKHMVGLHGDVTHGNNVQEIVDTKFSNTGI